MSYDFVKELEWRGMVHDVMPGTQDKLNDNKVAGYIGFDPTADSLHIGSLVQIILLMHLQKSGHTPIALIGGATGMIGDPSGKSAERNLLTQEQLQQNIAGVRSVLERFLDFGESQSKNPAILVNNYDWMKEFSLIDFSRDIGKHITVNYMMAKESVKKRINGEDSAGMSFTEFTYQLIQGYDFLHLYNEMSCKLQIGGSDQWGNITTGAELIRRKACGKAYAMTSPLVTKADGTKFGKTEQGNIWLDSDKTSVYQFYQFWLRASDEDAESWIKIFTFLDQNAIETLINEHREAPHQRLLQKKLGEEVTVMVHGREEYDLVVKASGILFGKATASELNLLGQKTLLDIFEGVPQTEVSREDLSSPVDIVTFITDVTGFLPSKSEARRALKENSLSVNKEKIDADKTITDNDIIGGGIILLQRGKKKYFLVRVH